MEEETPAKEELEDFEAITNSSSSEMVNWQSVAAHGLCLHRFSSVRFVLLSPRISRHATNGTAYKKSTAGANDEIYFGVFYAHVQNELNDSKELASCGDVEGASLLSHRGDMGKRAEQVSGARCNL
ncbi:hypothetical protein DAPPUDRAFT_236622 [Daphnia pulex]|uniref:Uncharacterized protein n=1 Tax=Daphnia pulex TaxID=6669 RepID=E9G2P7_DAPPU|nr:hypothetical protein DAPPUDRAFT_236622 [Daphnia pulex]|eukprot:EFX86085.1 hypothetical protein DAPPUDRAFT_236622 [Daphnia pulex]